jgi:hypothetical protein
MGAALAVLNARWSASLTSRARTSGDLLPRAASNVNTGVSARRTTPEAELGKGDALSAGDAEALSAGDAEGLGGGDAGAALVGEDTLGAGARAGAATTGAGGGVASGSGWRAESAGEACGEPASRVEAVADALAAGETDGAGAAPGGGFGGGNAEAETLAAADCAQTGAAFESPIAKQRQRNQSPQTRADVDELTEDLTLGPSASVTGLTTASTIERGHAAFACPHRPLEAVAKIRGRE